MINKIIMALTVVLASSFHSFSQQVQPGFKIGASVPDIKGNTEQSKNYSSRIAPFFGISVTKKISAYLNVQTELNYSPQGGKRNGMQPVDASQFGLSLPAGTTIYASFNNETKFNYLEIPLLLQLSGDKPQKDNTVFYFVHFGPFIAFRLDARTITSGQSQLYLDDAGSTVLTQQDGTPLPAQSFDSRTDIDKDIKKINAGIIGGIGSGYEFDRNKFFLEARFTRGFVNIQTHPNQNDKNRTGSLIFAAGYMYAFQ